MNEIAQQEIKKAGDKKKRDLLRGKIEKEKEIKRQIKRLNKIFNAANHENIDKLDDQALLGAILEINQKSKDTIVIENWYRLAEEYKKTREKSNLARLMIKFKEKPNEELTNQLRTLKIKFNRFLGRYCGYGDKQEINTLLANVNCEIEEVS